ncbi:MAG TPA: hypothetical protein VFU68_07360 [Terracidiphilus sp.]|nr:hypothetical protein [Terracidiphilus sp.]
MKTTTKWMLAAALAIGVSGLAATPAKAAQFGVYVGVGGQSYYAPSSPGPGYVWINGYYSNGYWVAGRWALADGYSGYVRHDDDDDYYYAPRYYRDRDDWNRDRDGWNRNRDGWNRDRGDQYRDRDRFDHDRGEHRGWDQGRHEGWRHDDDN